GNRSGSPATAAAAAHSIAIVDATTNQVSRVPISWSPGRLAVDAHTLWLANASDLTLARFDVIGRRIEQTIGLGVSPSAIATGAGAVWVLSGRTLTRVDPAFGDVKSRTLPIANSHEISVGDPAGLAVGANSVWVEDGVSTLLRVDPRTSAVLHRFELGKSLDGVAVGAGSVWVTRGSPATLIRIEPHTERVTAQIPIAGRSGVEAPYPIGRTVGAGAVWVLNGNTGTITRVDPTLNAVTATTSRISLNPIRIASGTEAVWVADNADDAVQQIDPTTNQVVRAIPVGGLPVALAARGGRVWASVEAR